MCELLNADARMCLGLERYKFIRKEIAPPLFTRERFFDIRKEDTNIRDDETYEMLRERWDSGTLQYVGDKIPALYHNMGRVWKEIPDAKFIFMLRDLERVASSYNRRASLDRPSWPKDKNYREAVRQWNFSLERLNTAYKNGNAGKLFFVHYESFFQPDAREYLEALYRFLGLDITQEVENAYEEIIQKSKRIKKKDLEITDEQRAYLDEQKLADLEAWALKHCLPEGVEQAV